MVDISKFVFFGREHHGKTDDWERVRGVGLVFRAISV